MDTIYLIPPIFFVISFVFSMIGMGGSQLYIPILFWMGLDFKTQAIPLGMLLNVVTSSSAAFVYSRKKLILWKIAIPFGICMVIFAPIGAWVNLSLPTKPVILIFAIFTAVAAILMLSGWKPGDTELSAPGRVVFGVSGGCILGFFAGLIGRGGGSFVVPLLFIVGLDLKLAAATSAMVVTCSGLSSFISHIAIAAQPDWNLWACCVVAVFLGSQTGSRLMVERLKGNWIKTIFGVVLLGVAAILIVKDVILG
ncbi:MAG: hypothetical protein C5S48_05315 [Candidatus Methanogaster sp.]|nr:MAG: hypothetical protein C5S48_05315 [ANME-2 cluster archaeon]